MRKVHLIGNAHVDPSWLWRWQEGFAEIKATFRSALDRMREFEDFIFTSAGAAHYAWVEENAPELFEEIRQRVREGRWVLAGGWWVQPDCNLPCGESFVRQGLYAQRYFKERFGRLATFGYNVDSFGHAGSLPQILVKSGMESYVFMRPDLSEKDLPRSAFWWESPDGSRVLAYRIPYGYQTGRDPAEIAGKLETLEALASEEDLSQMLFYGVGNHGGGPTIAALHAVEELRKKLGRESVDYSSPERYFAELRQDGQDLPVVIDDLQHHASGCYSTTSELKADNRKAENRLMSAEKMLVLAHRLLGMPYDRERIGMAWRSLLFNQFHDILAGTCIPEACDDARESFGGCLSIGAELLNAAVQKMSWSIDTMGGENLPLSKDFDWILWEQEKVGAPIVVFNPLAWDIHTIVEVPKQVKGVTDANGKALGVQSVRASSTNGLDIWNSIFFAEIPAMGYAVYHAFISEDHAVPAPPRSLDWGRDWLENDWLRLEIDAGSGWISRLYDKSAGAEVFAGAGAVPIVVDDAEHDTWAHGFFEFRDELGRFGDATMTLIETGPLRATLRVESYYGISSLRQDFTLFRDRPGLEVGLRLNWQEHHKILKLSFPVAVRSPRAAYEIPYGALERPVDGKENPGQSWLDVSGVATDGRTYGLALANTTKFGYDVLGSDLRVTLARSALYADHFGERDGFGEFMDQGIQRLRYCLVPHAGDWRDSGIVRKSLELNNPPIVVLEAHHRGPLPVTHRGIEVSAANIVASALKIAEDGEDIVLRCFESHGKTTDTEIALPFANARWTARFGRYEIKTFRIDSRGGVREVNLLEDEIS